VAIFKGNENASDPGDVILQAGNVAGGEIGLTTGGSRAVTVDFSGDLLLSAVTADITSDTSDGADNKALFVGGGGLASSSRGASITLKGNENATNPGDMTLEAGNVPDGEVSISVAGSPRVLVATTGQTELSVRNDSSCGIGTLCSGSFIPTVLDNATIDQSDVNRIHWTQVGNVVTGSFNHTFTINAHADGAGWNFDFTLPVARTSGNFSDVRSQSGGSCGAEASDTESMGGQITALVGSEQLNASGKFYASATSGTLAVSCTFMYRLTN
jgi:hypothetical protein